VLCLFESTLRAATAASTLGPDRRGPEAMEEMLGAARAAVIAASFALAQGSGGDGYSPAQANHLSAVPSR
jgi:hypothetical protein